MKMLATVNVAASEQDSGFEDLIEILQNEGHDITEDVTEKVLQQQQLIHTESQDKTKTISKSNNTAPAHKKTPSNKRGAGRPPKFHSNQFKCDSCDFITAYATHFRIHLSEVHQQEQVRIFKCIHCSEAYVEERFLHEHIKHIHECIPKRPKLVCDVCGKGFPKQSHLTRHSYVHKPNEKPLLCEHCPKRFANQSSLMRHIDARHVTKKPYACEICGNAFGHIYGLKAHKLNIH